MWRLSKRFTFEASHQLPLHDGKCRRLHGHSWVGHIEMYGEGLQEDGPKSGMVVDYSLASNVLKTLVEEIDHTHLNEVTGLKNPTSEELARWIYWRLKPALPMLYSVAIEETATAKCTYYPKSLQQMAQELKFWSKVKIGNPSDCWEWQGFLAKNGYGQTTGGGAHRFSWGVACGPIPAGFFVLHSCDNRKCVNPAHLFLGSAKQNTSDMVKKGRDKFFPGGPFPKWGEAHAQVEVSGEAVEHIRKRYLAGGVSMNQLAMEVGVTPSTVFNWVRRKTRTRG